MHTRLVISAEHILKQRCHGARTLLAVDEPVNREIVQYLLEDVDLIVDAAENGQEAVRKASQKDYACILIDMQMSQMDGLGSTRRLRPMDRCAPPQLPPIARRIAAKPKMPENIRLESFRRVPEPEKRFASVDAARA